MIKYRFEAFLQDKIVKKVCEYMRKIDLEMGEVGCRAIFSFTSERDVPLDAMKEILTQAIEECEVTVVRIEGGKIE
jgi:hypothetical protein